MKLLGSQRTELRPPGLTPGVKLPLKTVTYSPAALSAGMLWSEREFHLGADLRPLYRIRSMGYSSFLILHSFAGRQFLAPLTAPYDVLEP